MANVDQNLARNPWGRAVVVFLQADGEITYQVAGTAKWDAEPGLIVFGVDTVEQAQELQARFCSLDRDGSGRYHFPGIDSSEATRSFEQYFEKHLVAPDPVPVLRQALELALFGLTRDVDNNGGKIDRLGIVDTIRAALGTLGSVPQPLAEISTRICRTHPDETYTSDIPCPACDK